MLIGNYGVGKSTIIKEPIIKQETIFIEIRQNIWVLGEKICGADSLSKYKKSQVKNIILNNLDKNIIIAGNYYTQQTDVLLYSKYFDIVLIYLKTNYENNANRIKQRGGIININTFKNKLKLHTNLINKTKSFRKFYEIDNNKSIAEVKQEFYKIIDNETNRINTKRT